MRQASSSILGVSNQTSALSGGPKGIGSPKAAGDRTA